jgi:hypothetical protein
MPYVKKPVGRVRVQHDWDGSDAMGAARRRMILGGIGLAAGLMASYPAMFRSRCLTWGATPEEIARRLPGDELLESANIVSTRAISIDAPPSAIWPWLVQMGSGRGGAYSYDWIENLLGLDIHSANEVLHEFQDLKVGDAFPLGPPGGPLMRVQVLDPERSLSFRLDDGNWVWSFGLYPENGSTRLVSRNRIATPNASLAKRAANSLLMEPGSLVMERKMLKGIRQRAEKLAHRTAAGTPETSGTRTTRTRPCARLGLDSS